MVFDVFISYSSKDKTTADATCASLENAGIRCWIAPRDIRPGSEYGEALVDALDHCRAMVLIFSANANTSPQIRREVERVVSRGIPVVPLRIEDIAPTKSMAFFVGSVHWLDALTPPLEQHLRVLAEAVKGILDLDSSSEEVAGAGPRNDAPTKTAIEADRRREYAKAKPRVEEGGRRKNEAEAPRKPEVHRQDGAPTKRSVESGRRGQSAPLRGIRTLSGRSRSRPMGAPRCRAAGTKPSSCGRWRPARSSAPSRGIQTMSVRSRFCLMAAPRCPAAGTKPSSCGI